MNTLTWHDLQFALRRTPKTLLALMKEPAWAGKVFVGGGFLRSIVAGEPINDIDVFCPDKETGLRLARELVRRRLKLTPALNEKEEQDQDDEIKRRVYTTDNAYTLLCFSPTIQIIHRWSFTSPEQVAASFDFTNCCAVFWWSEQDHRVGSRTGWHCYCDDRFYPDVAAKRLIYRSPVRNEDAGGSMLRVLKYYQKGYRIPLDSLAAVIARLVQGVDLEKLAVSAAIQGESFERLLAKVLAGLLREVDPAIDPSHVAHLPAEDSKSPEPEAE